MLALSVCSSIYICVCLFGYTDRFSSFMKKTSHTLISRAQFQSNPIHLFIHSSLRVSLVENENPETQEKKKKKNQKRAKCPRRKKKKQKIIKCLVIDCTADFYYIDCNSFTQSGNSHMLSFRYSKVHVCRGTLLIEASEQAVTEVGIFLLPTMPMRSHEIEICLFLPPFPHTKRTHYSVGKQTDYFHTVIKNE